jgi:hypothetical protein
MPAKEKTKSPVDNGAYKKKSHPEGWLEKSRLKAKASSLSTRRKLLLPVFIWGVGKFILT